MEIIRKELKKEVRLKVLTGAAMVVFGELFCIYMFQRHIFLVIMGLVSMVFGVKIIYENFRFLKTDESPLMQLLLKQPEKIVWVYSMMTQRMPFGIEFSKMTILYFKLIDRDEITLSIPEKELNMVMKALNRQLPHATFGYTKDREQWFMAEPALLLRDDD